MRQPALLSSLQWAKPKNTPFLSVLLWLCFLSDVSRAILVVAAEGANDSCPSTTDSTTGNSSLPSDLQQPWQAYPNLLGLNEEDRLTFAPIVHFPRQCWKWISTTATTTETGKSCSCNTATAATQRIRKFVCKVSDFSIPSSKKQLLTMQEFHNGPRSRAESKGPPLLRQQLQLLSTTLHRWIQTRFPVLVATLQYNPQRQPNYIGRFDEDRAGLYTSNLFRVDGEDKATAQLTDDENEQQADSSCSQRTVHMGVDLAGYVGTAVYAFTRGTIHSVGYNPALGDYGHVMVVTHTVRDNVVVYTLYGHLDAASTRGKRVGDVVQRGQVLGWMGDAYDNGGWLQPHVHVQFALHAPTTPHDMPGAVCRDPTHRLAALQEYVDPRYIIGNLY